MSAAHPENKYLKRAVREYMAEFNVSHTAALRDIKLEIALGLRSERDGSLIDE